ncbi:uncharacterized protein LOC127260565 [Andrographis paniculata]|uniref:uncharacterized protein LOC127260565 n=1 Tax=Andrographis paniculata TaxID=175694 RepID=UPI0021E83687|nr:uncharacterized protein LOC127260565 [Andrographis paniculata]
MTCKKHRADLSSTVGVCASCLRDRLLAVVAAQSTSRHGCRRIDTAAAPPFPRSVSPYISRRKSDTAGDTWQIGGLGRRFYSTPQVGPTGSVYRVEVKERRTGAGGGRLSSLFGRLFRSKSGKFDFDSGPISEDPCSDSPPSWFSSLIPRRRKKAAAAEAAALSLEARRRRRRRNRDRGMSPARFSEEDDAHCYGGSSGYSSESSQGGWKQTPRRTPAALRRGGAGGRSTASANYASNLTFCLSPLVRASPNQRQKGIPPDTAAPVESRASPAAAAFFCKNRSRKLADLGRYSY